MNEVTELERSAEVAEAEVIEREPFEVALEKFRAKTPHAKSEIKTALSEFAARAVGDRVIAEDSVKTIKRLIAGLDEKISEQMNEILHNEKFQHLESAWRGLNYLVVNTESSTELKVRFMPISKKELGKVFTTYVGTGWDQSPIFKKIYGEELDTLGGEPYGCLVGDYYFNHSAPDVSILTGISQVAAAAHAPFIAAADPTLLNMDKWSEIANPRDLEKIFTTPDYATWNGFRESQDARYISLTMPRFLSRLPYNPKDNPVEGFEFHESIDGNNPSDFCWSNSAYAMAVNINRAFKEYGWCTKIRGVESGGEVTGLPVYSFPSADGGVEMTCPTEVAIGERRELELSKLGLMSLIHRKNTEKAAFIGAQTTRKPQVYDDPRATDSEKLSARLPYIFASSRFLHFLKVMVRDKVGSDMSPQELYTYLDRWIQKYVCPNPEQSSDAVKAKRPLAEASVVVESIPGEVGFYKTTFYIRPHYQLEGATVSMRLVTKMPATT